MLSEYPKLGFSSGWLNQFLICFKFFVKIDLLVDILSLLISNQLNVKPLLLQIPDKYSPLEILSVDLTVNRCRTRLIVVYRPPRFNDDETDLYNILLTNSLNYLANTCLKLCIFGDFNLPGVNWDTGSYPISIPYNILCPFFFDNGLHQLVLEHTRGNNILDLVFVSDPLLIRDIFYSLITC